MIESLRIAGLAVVDRLELELGPGLTALTGETGAGKSIVLGALELLAGARGSAERVREGAREAVVEAVFRTDRLPELEAELERRGLAPEEGELVVRRAIAAGGGRSRARVAGQLVPVSTLAELFARRIEISSQHETQALRRPETHARLLDARGGLARDREAVRAAYDALRACQQRAADLRARAAERARRQDFLAYQVREIDEAKLRPGELAALHAERARLAHAERLREASAAAAERLSGDPAFSDAPGATDLLDDAARRLRALAQVDPALGELAERLETASTDVRDARAELEHYAADIEAEPQRLAEIEARLAALERLQSRYGEDEAAVLEFRDRAWAELDEIETADERLVELEAERAQCVERLAKAADRLSAGRRRAARALARDVEAALRDLSLPRARFEVALPAVHPPEGAPSGPGGREAPEFRLAANPGDAPRPLHRVASGGELSRVFLALKNVLRQADAGMVLVFDEVDAGIGGRVADRVGRVLAQLASAHQVICITHLPQIAAAADAHLRVDKRERGGRAHTVVTPLEGDARVDELARMAGGATVSEATRRHAHELLAGREPSARTRS